jgi:hypothetical protein
MPIIPQTVFSYVHVPAGKETSRMAIWKTPGCIVLILICAAAARGQTYELGEKIQDGDCWQVEMEMSLSGEMRVTRDDTPVTLKMAASGKHRYVERALEVATAGTVKKMARRYEVAEATIAVGSDRSSRQLRPDRRLVVAQQHQGHAMVYCPSGPFTRAEMELTGEHFDTLALAGLLPGKAVKKGETWNISNDVVQFVCCFEGLSTQDLVGKLETVSDKLAHISIAGSATGIEMGAFVKLTVEATCQFDLSAGRLTALTWKQKDDRAQGPASPASTVETTSSLKRSVITQPDTLSDTALVSIPDGLNPPPFMTQLSYEYPGNPEFTLNYSRDWGLVGQTSEHVIFRLMDRGDFVAQATLTPWQKSHNTDRLTPAAFREVMAKTPGWQQGEVVQEGELPAAKGHSAYRIAALGEMDGMRVLQSFCLVTGPAGGQVVVVFTMTPGQVEKMGSRDVDFLGGIDLTSRRTAPPDSR